MNDLTVAVIIPAAGSGLRLGSKEVKALVKINGLSILEHVLKTVSALSAIRHITVLAPKESLKEFQAVISKFPKAECLQGGETRQISVFNGLKFLAEKFSSEEKQKLKVLIHDAARCLVTTDVIARAITQSKTCDALTCAVPVYDSLVRATEKDGIKEFVPREGMWAVQTPQVFAYQVIFDAHKKAFNDNRFDYTDDTSILNSERQINIVPGCRNNIKITEKSDLLTAEEILRGH